MTIEQLLVKLLELPGKEKHEIYLEVDGRVRGLTSFGLFRKGKALLSDLSWDEVELRDRDWEKPGVKRKIEENEDEDKNKQ